MTKHINNRRETIDIIYDILSFINKKRKYEEGRKKYHIYTKCNLSPKGIDFYIKVLMINNYIFKKDKFYFLSEEGIKYMKDIRKYLILRDKLKIDGLSKPLH